MVTRPARKIRFAVAGSGWRALFYVRAAKSLPTWFELTGVLCRTPEKASAFGAEHGVHAVATLEELLEAQPEFVVSCVNKAGMARMVVRLMEAGVPVLSETPLALDVPTLREIYAAQRRTGTPLELAEQYFLWPTHAARRAVIDRGLLGEAVSCWLSMAHDYHAVSLLRFYLNPDESRVAICARQTKTPIVMTGGRGGYVTDGQTGEEIRTFAQLDYADGKQGLYDFSGTQYHSAIRSSHIRVLGTRGEIFDDTVRYLDGENRPREARLSVHRDVITGTIRSIDFDGERVYVNPFPGEAAMSEDEIAVAEVICRMGTCVVREGKRFYREGYRDAYLSALMLAALQTGGRAVSERMEWDGPDRPESPVFCAEISDEVD